MKHLILFLAVLGLLLTITVVAQVPSKISYQGLLTTSSGIPVPDGSYDLQFDIFDVQTGGSTLWTEGHSAVTVSNGTFSVILGSVAGVGLTFDQQYYVEVTAVSGPGISSPITFSPRSELTSAPYSLGLSIPNTLTTAVNNAEVLKVVNNKDGTALVGEVHGVGSSGAIGISASGESNGTGAAFGGIFSASGTGESQKTGISCSGNGNTFWDVYGLSCAAGNNGSGPAYGGNFRAFSPGTGIHYGVYSDAYGSTSATYGLFGYGKNTSTGPTFGVYSKAENTSSGDARGGYFLTDATNRGTGTRFGIDAIAAGGGTYPTGTFAVKGWSSNNSSGDSYGGYFTSYAEPGNTGWNYGSFSEGYSLGSASAFGVVGFAESPSTGEAYGGSFYTSYYNRGGNKRYGISASAYSGSTFEAYGVKGYAVNESFGDTYGGYFTTDSNGTGVHHGVYCKSYGNTSTEIHGIKAEAENSSSGSAYAGYFSTSSSNRGTGYRAGVWSMSYGADDISDGVYGLTDNSGLAPAYGGYFRAEGSGGGTKYGIYGSVGGSGTKYAGYFSGNVTVTGTLSKGGGSFKIDHPLDPENKYLSHSFVESPDMMNIYNGNVTLDINGEVIVELPKYFDALNKDFRYQLTSIGGYANVYIAEEITNNRFRIAGGSAGLKVSWQVTGIRKDKFAEANRIQVEVDKPTEERGKFMHPEVFGLIEDRGIHYEMHKVRAEELKKMQEEELKHKGKQQKSQQGMQEQIKREAEQRKARLEEQKKKYRIE